MIAVGLAAGLATACSKPSPDNASASSTATSTAAPMTGSPACAALTAPAASAVLNETVTLTADTPADADPGQSRCTYGTVGAYVTVGPAAKHDYDMFKDGVTEHTALPGVGDEAFTSDQGVGAVQGAHFVSVIGGGEVKEQALAKAMLAALAK
jgi:hypothetical protein